MTKPHLQVERRKLEITPVESSARTAVWKRAVLASAGVVHQRRQDVHFRLHIT
jgi:hypothetical protein